MALLVNTTGLSIITETPIGSVSYLRSLGFPADVPGRPGVSDLWGPVKVTTLAGVRGLRAYGCHHPDCLEAMRHLWDLTPEELERRFADGFRYFLVVRGRLVKPRLLSAAEMRDADGGTAGLRAAWAVGLKPVILDLQLVYSRVQQEMAKLAVKETEGPAEARERLRAALEEGQTCKG